MKPVQGKGYWALTWIDNSDQFVLVPRAYPVKIEGFEALDLFAYRSAWLPSRCKDRWYVVEAKSGLSVCAATRTKAEAVQRAREMILQYGLAEMERAIRSRVEETGLSPRYLDDSSSPRLKPSDSTSSQSKEDMGEKMELNRTVHPCDAICGEAELPVYIFLRYEDGRLALSGAIGSMDPMEAREYGQIDIRFAHRRSEDNTQGFPLLTNLRFRPGWTSAVWLRLLDIWKAYRLCRLSELPSYVHDWLSRVPE
jgi:hypothetical protein